MNKVDEPSKCPFLQSFNVIVSSNSRIRLNLDTQPTTAHARLAYEVGPSFEEATILTINFKSFKFYRIRAVCLLLHYLHSYLEEVRRAGENAAEFFQLYQRLTQPTYWKFYLALQGALLQIGQLLTKVRNLSN